MPVLNRRSSGSAAAATDRELFKLQDRRGADLVLAMTHEEVVGFHVAQACAPTATCR